MVLGLIVLLSVVVTLQHNKLCSSVAFGLLLSDSCNTVSKIQFSTKFASKDSIAFPREVTEETVKADTYGAQQSYCNLQSNIATNRSKNKD